ncbi:hypothetical protein G5B00_11740 [Parapedobacter sp. SGR-10]|nr:hypothetical protein [Parapedobacter sp. SGR-10]NGF57185.1 hypothetical protein [Parapedobacter sp. SGR-10]
MTDEVKPKNPHTALANVGVIKAIDWKTFEGNKSGNYVAGLPHFVR